MTKNILYVGSLGFIVAALGVLTIRNQWPVGLILLGLTVIPIAGILYKGPIHGAIPDLIFGVIDTGLLAIPAVWGGAFFGVAGAIAGTIIGDAITDGIAGFFEGSISEALEKKGIQAAREPITTSLGKMAGCLLGSGIVLTFLFLIGIKINTF